MALRKMAATRLVVGAAVVALLCAGAVTGGAAPAQQLPATWLEKSAGLTGQKLTSAISICEVEEIETIAELQEVNDGGGLQHLGSCSRCIIRK